MNLIDTHCHLTFKELATDIEAVVTRSIEAGVTSWVTVGTDMSQNREVVKIVDRFENMYAGLGIHPHYAKDVTDDDIAELKKLAKNKKVVAIGETGLDFHYNNSPKPDQQRAFVQQLEVAQQLGLPVIIHAREAFDEVIEILEKFGSGIKKLVFHCFGGSSEQVAIILDKGFYVSFTGMVTFKNAETVRLAAKSVPIDRLMVETDCPFISPVPMRGQKINEPAFMVHTAECLAELKEMTLVEFAEKVNATSKAFFGLPTINNCTI